MMLTLSQSIGQSNQLRELPPLVVFLDLWIQVLDFYIDNKTIIQNPPDTFWTGGTVWVSLQEAVTLIASIVIIIIAFGAWV